VTTCECAKRGCRHARSPAPSPLPNWQNQLAERYVVCCLDTRKIRISIVSFRIRPQDCQRDSVDETGSSKPGLKRGLLEGDILHRVSVFLEGAIFLVNVQPSLASAGRVTAKIAFFSRSF
jgi:hypothetical protein